MPPIIRPLTSSNLASAGYDEELQELVIRFKSGSTYIYSDVDADTAEGLFSAPSAGVYFHDSIKDQFSYRRV